MCKNFRRYALNVALVLVLSIILLWVSVPAFASWVDSITVTVTATPNWSPPIEPSPHSYGIYLEAGEAHPAWRMVAVLPYIGVFVGLVSLLSVGFSIGGLVTGAILIVLTANFIPVIWYMIP